MTSIAQSSTASEVRPSLENSLIESYLSARFRLPDVVLRALLTIGVEGYYALGKRLDTMPRQWAGDQGDIVPACGLDAMTAHYDLPAAMFEKFIGRTMKYSMALWEDGAADLDSAQEAMMADVCRKVDMQDGLTVLDIGCGFGSFASFVLTRYPRCSVYGLTVSDTQYRYVLEKQRQPGHPLNSPRFRIAKEDFGQSTVQERFDRIVCIGVFEHIPNLKRALATIRRFMKDDAACLVHYCAYRKLIERYANCDMSDTFIRRYFYPDTRFWHDRELFKYQDDLRIDQYWFLSGRNYQRTLEAWRENFMANWDEIRRIRGDGERVYRMFNYYFRFTRALFKGQGGRQSGNGQYLLRPR